MAKFPLTKLAAVLLALGLSLHPADAATKKKSSSSSSKKPAAKAPAKTAVRKPAPAPEPAPVPLAPGELPLAARSALSLDLATGKVLYEKAPDEMEYPASSTKILTALLVLEAGDLDKPVTVELCDTKVEPSALEVKPGEVYTRRNLLYALLLKSANDVAMVLARDNAGSVEAFAEKMTERARQLGATCSHFTNPHGLHNPHHFTTARDLALIAKCAMAIPLFREIVATPKARLEKAGMQVELRNHNRLLEKFFGCNGVKTGYTVPAQQVLVSSAIREGREVLSVVLHTNKPGIWEDSKLLLLDGFQKLGVNIPQTELPPCLLAPTVPAGPAAPGSPGAPLTPPSPAAAGPVVPPNTPTIAGEARSSIVPAMP